MFVMWVPKVDSIEHKDSGKCEICNKNPAAFRCLDCLKRVCADEASKHYELCHSCSENIKRDIHDHGGSD